MVNKSFDFSVIMAVYNVEAYLEEAVESLIQQDYGFDHIQLILVDDGSPDNSGKICDTYQKKYPDNIFVLHQENAGVSAARNAGLELATGTYLNFMDSDDKLERNAMSEVKKFFDTHGDETDVVSIPLRFFDGQEGDSHPQNKKFRDGNRVIDLSQENATQLSCSSSFLKRQFLKDIRFDVRLAYAEDAKTLALYFLQNTATLGVVGTTHYLYRKRSTGSGSAIQNSARTAKSYLPVIDFFHYEILEKLSGPLPHFVQVMMAYDLQWRFKPSHIPHGVLTKEEEQEYIQKLYGLLQYLDDDVILALENINDRLKCHLLCSKHHCTPELKREAEDLGVYVKGHRIGGLADCGARLEFVTIKDGALTLEGWLKTYWMGNEAPLRAAMNVNGETIPCEIVDRPNLDQLALGSKIEQTLAFRCCMELPKDGCALHICPVLQYRETEVKKIITSCGPHSPIGRKYGASYYCEQGWLVRYTGQELLAAPARWYSCAVQELRFCAEIWRKNEVGGRKAVLVRLLAHLGKLFKRRQIWLISDRTNKAGDNGEAFFRYMRAHHPETRAYFVINSDAPEVQSLQEIGKVIPTLSMKHKLLFLIADYNISAHADDITSNPFPGYSEPYRDILARTKNIFLQHGVTKDDLSGWLNRYKKNLYGFVTSVEPEYKSVIDGNYYYTEKQVWLTGFPRYDYLYNDSQKMIVIAPTWRRYLAGKYNQASGVWSIKPDFEESEYVKFYAGLLSHPRLLEKAQQMGYAIHFFPHPNFQPYIQCFHCPSSIVLHGKETHYRDMYAQASLFVTDYSSACFDFVYLYKPVIYCQFDAKTFFSGAHSYTKGYFDYERDGFGEVEYDLEGTVERIIEYMETDCKLKEKYRKRIDDFFAFHDKKNCERVYQKLVEHSDID